MSGEYKNRQMKDIIQGKRLDEIININATIALGQLNNYLLQKGPLPKPNKSKRKCSEHESITNI